MTAVHWVLIGLVVSTMATASPTPSPALDKVLAPAPSSDYVEADATSPSVMEGSFNAQQYAARTNSARQSQVQASLERNGFIAGFGRTWVQRSTQHVLIEAVLAFDGARDAKKWLTAAQLSDKADPKYQHPITAPGIANYYGAHMAGNDLFTDTFGIVRGNDYFWIITISRQDDLGSVGATQAKAVYDFAPPYTIPPSQWPESIATPRETVSGFGPPFLLLTPAPMSSSRPTATTGGTGRGGGTRRAKRRRVPDSRTIASFGGTAATGGPSPRPASSIAEYQLLAEKTPIARGIR